MKFQVTYTLDTPRCLLRHVSKNDIPHIFSASRTERFTDGMLWDPPEKEEDLLHAFETNVRAWQEDRGYAFSIVEKTSNDFIGRISISPKADHVWNIGFWTHPNKQNRGYMTEAILAVIGFGFNELKAQQIISACATWNIPSEKVLGKAGMRFQKLIPEGFQKHGKWIAVNLYQINCNEWGRT